MSTSLSISGLKDLEEKLLQLGNVGAPKIARAAVRKSVEPVLADARRFVPKRTGALYDALAITTRGPGGKGAASNSIATAGLMIRSAKAKKQGRRMGTGGGTIPAPRRYWHLVEFGTSRTSAQPYIRPAFDGRLSDMLDRLRQQLADKIERARRKALKADSP